MANGGAFDPDATVVRPWPDPGAAADPDATVVRVPTPDHDATVVRAAQALPLPATAREEQLALAPGYQLHEYRIDQALGQGGFGITYLATDVNLRAPVAIKEYLPAEIAFRAGDRSVMPNASEHRDRYQRGLDAFLVEARTLAGFRHPAVVRVARFFEAHRTAYMVLEYVRGQSLKVWWPPNRQMSEVKLVEKLMPLFEGLAQVHAAGVLHRDIKPDNIQVRAEDGSFVLLDFGSAGLAVVVPEDEAVIVTPGYAPPEQYGTSGHAQGPWTDIYALAATLYWLVCGRKVPDAELRQMNPHGFPSAREAGKGRYGENFLNAIDAGLAMNPADRPQDIDAFGRLLFADHLSSLGLQDALRLGESTIGGHGGHGVGIGTLRAGTRRIGGWLSRWRRGLRLLNPAAWPLAAKLALAFVLTALLPMALTAAYNLGQSLKAVEVAELDGLEQLAGSVAGRLGQLIADTRHLTTALASDRDVVNHLQDPDADRHEVMRAKLERLVAANANIQLLMLLDKNGMTQVSSDPEVIGRNFRFRQYFQRAMAGEAVASGITVGAVTGTAGMFFSEPVRDAQQQIVGVAALRLRGLAVASILDQVNPAAGLVPMLVDADGVVIHHPRENLMYRSLMPLPAPAMAALVGEQRFGRNQVTSLDQAELARAMLGAKASGHVAYRSTVSGVDEIAGYAPVPGHEWVVAVSETRDTFERPQRSLYRNVLLSMVLVGMLFTGLALRFARSIVQPVRALTQAAEALKNGDFDAAHVHVKRRDELGTLARTFNVMIDVLRQRERERDRTRGRG